MENITCPIVDAHAHIFPEKIAQKATQAIGAFYDIAMQQPQGLADKLLEAGAKAGICKYLVCSSATVPAQVQSINNFIYEACLHTPQFIGLGTLHPFMEGLEEEVERIAQLGLRGIKLHPDFQKFYIDDEKAMTMYRCLAKYRLPVLFHTGDARYEYSAPTRLRRVLDAVDGFVAIGAHFGGYNRWQEARAVLQHPNVYYDTSSALFKLPADEAADLLREYGAEKCMFGTDFPMWEPVGELERFMAMPLTQAEREQVFYKTFCNLFGVAESSLL